jgi:hypothetical protein
VIPMNRNESVSPNAPVTSILNTSSVDDVYDQSNNE